MENNNKPFIITMAEMRQEISDAVNKYMPLVPSDIIADTLSLLINSLRQNGQTQLTEALQLYQQSQEVQEVVENADNTEVSSQDELRDTETDE